MFMDYFINEETEDILDMIKDDEEIEESGIVNKDVVYHPQTHDTLNPKLWDKNQKLLPEVKEALIKIVDAFVSELPFELDVLDIWILGSSCNYNYHENSDMDVNIQIDMSLIEGSEELKLNYFWEKKERFNKTYRPTIKGIPVEVYPADIHMTMLSNGIYSVGKDSWIKKPEKVEFKDVDVDDWIESFNTVIDQTLETENPQKIKNLLSTIWMIRKAGLTAHGDGSKSRDERQGTGDKNPVGHGTYYRRFHPAPIHSS